MKLFLIYDYKNKKAPLTGKELTDAHIRESLDDMSAEILRTDDGKPYIEGGPHFSVSHSDNLLALVVSSHEIGIDIQDKRDIDVMKLANRFFAKSEIDLINRAMSEGGKERAKAVFFELWAMKEAYCKYTGRGIAQILDKTEVVNIEDVIFENIAISDDYVCIVCYGKGGEVGNESNR